MFRERGGGAYSGRRGEGESEGEGVLAINDVQSQRCEA